MGTSRQQIRSYENATDQVRGSKIFELAVSLGVDPDYFFEGLDGKAEKSKSPGAPDGANDDTLDLEGTQFATAYWSLPSKGLRAILFRLVKAMAQSRD